MEKTEVRHTHHEIRFIGGASNDKPCSDWVEHNKRKISFPFSRVRLFLHVSNQFLLCTCKFEEFQYR